jgi:hypothetical protein
MTSQSVAWRLPEARRQLSMFAAGEFVAAIEAVRMRVDPIQAALIPAHITLCREDELADLSIVKSRLADMPFKPLVLSFGKAEVFADHGLLLNCLAGADAFRSLRKYLLNSNDIKNQLPHISLAHPRNPKSPENVIGAVSHLPRIMQITFTAVFLIEQTGNEPWRVLESYTLRV